MNVNAGNQRSTSRKQIELFKDTGSSNFCNLRIIYYLGTYLFYLFIYFFIRTKQFFPFRPLSLYDFLPFTIYFALNVHHGGRFVFKFITLTPHTVVVYVVTNWIIELTVITNNKTVTQRPYEILLVLLLLLVQQ